MITKLYVMLFAASANSLLHHLIVGTSNGQALYSLEMNDEARTVYYIQARDASGTSPSLALDNSKKYLFSSRPENATLTRYSIGVDYGLLDEGTVDIPAACNTTAFASMRLTSVAQNFGIWGSASTGACSVLFALSTDGYTQLRSKEIAGDVHSLAWGANGRSLHALDSHASSTTATSIANYRITEDPSLEDVLATDVLANVSDASQVAFHPRGNRFYVVTKATNELISAELQETTNTTKLPLPPSRYRLLPSSLDASQFRTSSLTITASKDTLWTLSQSTRQAIVTVFSLNTTTGEVIDAVARASWAGAGEGQITAAPFSSGNVVAVTSSPTGYVTLLGLDRGLVENSKSSESFVGHEWLMRMDLEVDNQATAGSATPKIKSYGRTALDEFISMGESVWVD
ncbi:hypothetical protein HBH70_016790 [Parastagonospora nodorum]|nr:hypothetical protein HBH51_112390 [Parastagonospora nodorum]KAH4238547.1 hypothetical protein HBI06_038160 [Parastagonospora nodorum]KAH4239008.1 hypothetical protein HBI05_121140 [Parastagonospora nodorum]KAH4934528.1 hypothetical protein HBI79_086990 [Parastagonospora nodorum]KAH4992610.1 hypothetical protein HBI76_046540 [Parastagonospora nodorum]